MWFIFIWFLVMLFPRVVSAAVVVNEVYPQPNTGEPEWVELLNDGDSAVDLDGWQLWDELSSANKIHQFSDVSIEPSGFVVVELQNVLNNGGDGVVLKNELGEQIDQLTYSSSTKSLSWARNPDDFGEVFASEPTKNAANLAPTPNANQTLSPSLTEIMACPADGTEWVELFNPHNEKINLTGLTLHDDKNQIWSFADQLLDPHQYLAVDLKNVLNNGGDSVSLFSADNQLIESFNYDECDASQSWAKRDNNWEQTNLITKNAANLFANDPSINSALSGSSIEPAPESTVAGAVAQALETGQFLYPPSVLKPKLNYRQNPYPPANNIVFSDPPRLEKGALSVIMGSLLLLIPSWSYVKTKQQHF